MRAAVLYSVATPLVVVPALAVLGTFLHGVPYVGVATAFAPWFLSWLIVSALLGGVLAAVRFKRSRYAAGLTIVAVLAVISGSVITARMTAAVEHAGADIDLVDVFGIGSQKTATPDDEAVYATFDGQPQRLSIYRPPEPSVRAPVLVYIHGGGFIAGDRHAHSADLRWFAEQGWLTISVDYPLSSGDRHLWDVTQDRIGCALSWIGDHAQDYGGDAARLSVTGDSAGGNLAINTAYMAADGTLRSACGGRVPPVAAVSALYPVVDPADSYDNADPALRGSARSMVGSYTGGSPQQFGERYAHITSSTHISADAPPTLVIVPEADHLVPPGGAYRFAEQAKAAGVEVELVGVPYADHVFDARPGSIGQQAYRQLTAKWLRDHGQDP
jgi:acetyl esterase/lipase